MAWVKQPRTSRRLVLAGAGDESVASQTSTSQAPAGPDIAATQPGDPTQPPLVPSQPQQPPPEGELTVKGDVF